ncbi:hypothetical protein [Peribacillus frigoritolerans]|uniref:hypothetical protein n=1 Tax=Peribacillus frigoritolerans TaxID=450367 RepID=UPI003DA02CC4
MLKIETYIPKPEVLVQNYLIEKLKSGYSGNIYKDYPELCYIPLDDSEKIKELIQNDEIESSYIQTCIVIKKGNDILLGFELNGLNLWDEIILSLRNLVEEAESERLLGIDPIILKMKINNEHIEWKIYDEEPPYKVYYQSKVNRIEFIEEIMDAGKNYYETMTKYFPKEKSFKEHKKMLSKIGKKLLKLGSK